MYKRIRLTVSVIGVMLLLMCGCGDNQAPVESAPAPADSESAAAAPAAVPEATEAGDSNEVVENDDVVQEKDLFDYYGANIESFAGDFSGLQYDDSYKTAEGGTTVSGPTDTMEMMSDGLALAGPFFTIDNNGDVIGIHYGGKKFTLCEIAVGMSMSEAADLAKSHGFNFSRVEIAHGTAKYVAIYDNGVEELSIVSDADGEFGKTEESDVTGNVDDIVIYKLGG